MARRGQRGKRGISRIERYIRDAAVKRGIDPDVAVAVAKSEGGVTNPTTRSTGVKNGRRERSYGPFQLNLAKGAVGWQALKKGIDPRNPEDVYRGIDFALDFAAKNGWGAWSMKAARAQGIGNRTGLRNSKPIGIQAAQAETPAAAALFNPKVAETPALAGLFAPAAAQAAVAPEARAMGEGMFARPATAAGTVPSIPAAERFGPAPSQFGGLLDPDAGAAGTEGGAPFAGFDAQRALSGMGRLAPSPVAETEADVQRMEREQGMFQPSVAQAASDRFAGLYDRMNPARMADPVAQTTQDMAIAHLTGPEPPSFETRALDVNPTKFGTMVGGMVGPPSSYVDLGAAEKVKDKAQERLAPGTNIPGTNVAGPAVEVGPTAAAPAVAGPAINASAVGTAMLGQVPKAFTPPEYQAPEPYTPEPTIAAGDYPTAPPEPEEEGLYGPVAKTVVETLLGGPVGLARDALSGTGIFSGPAGRATADIDAGTGVDAIERGMYGPRGTFGRSASNPGAFTVSRGPGQGYDLTNQYGARTTYGPSGDVRANKDTLKAWGNWFGGLFDRPDKKDKDKDRPDDGWGGYGPGLY